MREEQAKKEKNVARILIFFLGVLLPIFALVLVLNACPPIDDATFELPIPFITAKCPGDFIAQIILFIFALPFTITVAFTLFIEVIFYYALPDSFNMGYLIFGLPCLLGLIVNTLAYWLIIKGTPNIYQKIKTRVAPPHLE